jgi:hypothetical protein
MIDPVELFLTRPENGFLTSGRAVPSGVSRDFYSPTWRQSQTSNTNSSATNLAQALIVRSPLCRDRLARPERYTKFVRLEEPTTRLGLFDVWRSSLLAFASRRFSSRSFSSYNVRVSKANVRLGKKGSQCHCIPTRTGSESGKKGKKKKKSA